MRSSSIVALAASLSSALAQYKGFNYGSSSVAGVAFTQADFEAQFTTAQGLVGNTGFSSARLYTMIQAGSVNTVISAIPAAIATKTTLLLGLWASSDQAIFDNEITALKNAITQYGADLAPLLAGISVGSEDLYRISPPAVQAGSTNPGQSPATLVDYIGQVRAAVAGTTLSAASIGHVDTWTAWVNGTNSIVTSAVDWVGVDAYPYFQNTQVNGIAQGASLFEQALGNTTDAALGKPVWVTETGWPVSGATENLAVPSVANAQTYWDTVGCDLLFGKYNTWWYTLQDFGSTPSFGVVGETLSTTPLYDLTCSGSSSATSSSATVSVSSVASATVPTTVASGATSATATIDTPVPGPSLGTQSGSVSAASATVSAVTTTLVTATVASSTAAAAASGCPADLNGDYQYPHLIVPVSASNPNTAYGTQYNGKINSDVSTIFNFDIPASYAGKQCSLVFLFPEQSQLVSSSFTFNGEGGIVSHVLSAVADQSTTFANQPSQALQNGMISAARPGNSYVISSDSCPGNTAVSFELSSYGGLDLEYFQDYAASPIGLYVRAC